MNMLNWILIAVLLLLLAFHLHQMHFANKALNKYAEHHAQLHAKLLLADRRIEQADPIIRDSTQQITGLEAQQITMQARIDELVNEVALLEERTGGPIDPAVKGEVMAKQVKIDVLTEQLQELRSELIKTTDKLAKSERVRVAVERELAENREAADHAGDDIMAIVDATRTDV